MRTAGEFGLGLARQGALVVSGSALGVDAAALKGALRGGGRVVSVMGNGIDNCKTFRLPVVGTYKEERRNDNDMLYDCDFKTNQVQLYNFIYG